MEWSEGDLVWFETNIGHPLPGEIQEVHRAAQVIIVQALINGKVSGFLDVLSYLYKYWRLKLFWRCRIGVFMFFYEFVDFSHDF